MRQQQCRVAPARHAQLARDRNEQLAAVDIEDLRRRQVLGPVEAAGDQHSSFDQRGGRGAGPGRGKTTGCDRHVRFRVEQFRRCQRGAALIGAADDQRSAVGEDRGRVPCARHRHCPREHRAAGRGIEDLDVGIRRAVDEAARDDNASVGEDGGGRVHSRSDQLTSSDARVCGGVVQDDTVGGAPVSALPTRDHRAAIGERNRDRASSVLGDCAASDPGVYGLGKLRQQQRTRCCSRESEHCRRRQKPSHRGGHVVTPANGTVRSNESIERLVLSQSNGYAPTHQ